MDQGLYISQMLIMNNQKILIDWTPKSGCTTVCKMVFKKLGILNEALNHSSWIHNYRGNIFYKKYGTVNKNELLNGKYNNFLILKFVRNPYSRAVSSYIHAMKTKLHNLVGSNNISFIHFLNLLKTNKRLMNEGHWRVQKLNYENDKSILNKKFIKIEDMNNELIKLKKSNNINFEYNFSSNHHIKKNEGFKKFVGGRKFNTYKNNIPNYRYFYNEKIIKFVEEIYKDDIKTYNYTYQEFLKDN